MGTGFRIERAGRALAALLALAALAGCGDEPSDATPSGAVTLFLEAMQRSGSDPEAVRDAYRLLAAPTRRALQQRAHAASSLGGREFAPWEMLVPGRYRQSFTPRQGGRGMVEAIEGDRATVTVTSEDGDRRAEIPLVREEGAWRIVVELPPVRPE